MPLANPCPRGLNSAVGEREGMATRGDGGGKRRRKDVFKVLISALKCFYIMSLPSFRSFVHVVEMVSNIAGARPAGAYNMQR